MVTIEPYIIYLLLLHLPWMSGQTKEKELELYIFLSSYYDGPKLSYIIERHPLSDFIFVQDDVHNICEDHACYRAFMIFTNNYLTILMVGIFTEKLEAQL